MKNKRIYTREFIDQMTSDEFSSKENEIMEQMRSSGIPFSNELSQKQVQQNQKVETSKQEVEHKLATCPRAQEILNFIEEHIADVGKEQAIKDVQRGINLLNKGKAISAANKGWKVKYDGDFGDKTKARLIELSKHYTLGVIKKYIKRGAVNNIIFDTKDNRRINTERKVNKVLDNLKMKWS